MAVAVALFAFNRLRPPPRRHSRTPAPHVAPRRQAGGTSTPAKVRAVEVPASLRTVHFAGLNAAAATGTPVACDTHEADDFDWQVPCCPLPLWLWASNVHAGYVDVPIYRALGCHQLPRGSLFESESFYP